MTRMLDARMVRLEGIGTPCILLQPLGEVPEELVISFAGVQHPEVPKKGPTTFRLVPSTAQDPEPLYRELFQE
jgi:hypothetical protein